MKFSLEKLYHFQCESLPCRKWWSIGDAPLATKAEWYCPWCGTKQNPILEDLNGGKANVNHNK